MIDFFKFQSGILMLSLSLSLFSAHAQNTIKVGAVISITGAATFLGDPQQKTLEQDIAKINAQGGVLGRKLELIMYDDGSDAGKSNAFAKRLIIQDEVDAIIGASTTGSTMAMLSQIEAAKIPTLSLGGASVIVEPVKPYVFKMPHSDRMAAYKVLEDMKKRGFTQFALLSDTGGYGKSGRTETIKAAEALNIKLVEDQQYGDKDTDMTPQLTKIKSSGAQAVLIFGSGQAPSIIVKNCQQLQLKQALYTTHGQASMEFIRLAGKAAEGIRMPSPALMIASSLAVNDPQRNVSLAYEKAFESQYKIEVSTFGAYAHDALYLLVDAIKRAGSTDKEKVRTALEQTNSFVGVSGIYKMSATDHMGLDISAFKMVEIAGGNFKEVK